MGVGEKLKRRTLARPVFAAWCFAYLAAAALAGSSPGGAAASAQALLLLTLVALQGSSVIGLRGIALFAVIVALVTFGLEACSIATGFPFGFYVHHMPGPRLLGVPATVVIAYVLLSWFAWSVACALIRDDGVPGSVGLRERLTTPIVAALVLTGYDFAFDPIGATALHLYSYRFPSGTFGVPLTNFLGWLFTGWVAFQLFALVEPRRTDLSLDGRSQTLLPCFVWLVLAAQYPLLLAHAPAGISAAGNRQFITADIYEFALSASLFSIVLPAVAAIARVTRLTGVRDLGR